ncbi:hypothetical protein [Natribacillus halophilus]|uniref:hypothetical protein n=1 Tax=Natribacillus halophilus TaxID=549003 RepID=UPI00116003C9|nr:hypothetical protein [Natribacillus halophilus]
MAVVVPAALTIGTSTPTVSATMFSLVLFLFYKTTPAFNAVEIGFLFFFFLTTCTEQDAIPFAVTHDILPFHSNIAVH